MISLVSGVRIQANALGTSSQGVCLADLECVDEGHYTGNQGDARVYRLDGQPFSGYSPTGYNGSTKRNGNIGIDGTVYENGFEVWIARWNFGDNISWAYRTFKLDGQYHTLTGSSGIIKSYNTNNYDVTAYFYSGDDLLYSFQMTPSSNQFDFSIDVSGVDELKVLVKDNIKTSGGTSYALYNLFLDSSSYTSTPSNEITHLIFADMAYARIPKQYEKHTVAEWLEDGLYCTASGYGFHFKDMEEDEIYTSGDLVRKNVYSWVGDWTILELEDGSAGYAAAVFRKDDDIIIAYRGSEAGPSGPLGSFFSGEDWYADVQFALTNYLNPEQFGAALQTYYRYSGSGNVTLAGHSLGGALVTYVSTLTNASGYAFDGACGHVIDLTYLFEPANIDFSSKDNMSFTNYTDPESASSKGADLIQHTNANLFPGICYKTNPEVSPWYNTLIRTHQIYSNTRPCDNGVGIEFMPIAETHAPKPNWYASVDLRYLGLAIGAGGGLSTGNLGTAFVTGKNGAHLGRLIKTGNVLLGSGYDDTLTVTGAISNPWDISATVTTNVIYGGDGSDSILGCCGPDILVPGVINGDVLCGGAGNDDYLIDNSKTGYVHIADQSGKDRIVLLNADSMGTNDIQYQGTSSNGEYLKYNIGGTVQLYILKKTNHTFSVIDRNERQICTIDCKGNVVTLGDAPDDRGSRSKVEIPEEASKEITITGNARFEVYGEDNTVIASYLTNDHRLSLDSFGIVYVGENDDGNFLTATIYESYHTVVIGDESVDICIVGTDTYGFVNKTTLAKEIDLSVGDASVDLAAQTITQNGETIIAEETVKTTSIQISQDTAELFVGDSAELNAAAFFADGTESTDVYWMSSDDNIISVSYDDNGNCAVYAKNEGTAFVYAVAADSGYAKCCSVTVSWRNPFDDVKEGKYYYKPILWAYYHIPQVTSGTSETTFSPNDTCTRAQIVTFLWKVAGSPEPTTTNNPFSDVKADKYYYKAVLWAAETGITSGSSNTTFSPKDGCTRAQVVTFLWRFAGSPEPNMKTNPFVDVPVGKYYEKAVMWAAEKGITAGTSETTFSPHNTCARAQIVTFLYKYMEF